MKKEQFDVHARLGMNHWWHYGTKSFFRKLVERHLPYGSSILDAGCGVGDMILLLKDRYRIAGLDTSDNAVQYCARRGLGDSVTQGNLSSLPFDNNSFDGILSLDVLYHEWVTDDRQALKEMYRILRPGGKIFIQLPAYEWLKSDHDKWALSSRRYTAGRLSAMLTEAGFVRQRVGYRVFFLFPIAALRRSLLKKTGSDFKEINSLLNLLLRLIISGENLLALFISFPFGLSVFGVAEK